ncbi:predicted protein [Streptomyces viridosporus ATCC 14672]|uniref:Predicted protein n=1 Tax=Streptomyces viridosporus (strain ATCC 14672 / DSM 40746 / JCM 4963 / KCTC 9882 / NRRL B-12104 / FH 1290) TaxID=566461 RepID=D6A416_STRV1|nr:predicted protein [Streptomyces viridosporus ATCC 14672]
MPSMGRRPRSRAKSDCCRTTRLEITGTPKKFLSKSGGKMSSAEDERGLRSGNAGRLRPTSPRFIGLRIQAVEECVSTRSVNVSEGFFRSGTLRGRSLISQAALAIVPGR